MLLTVSMNSVRYFATFCVTAGVYTSIGLVLAWCKSLTVSALCILLLLPSSVSHNLGSETKTAAGVPLFNSLGQCGSILGSHLFPSEEGPRYMSVTLPLLFAVRLVSGGSISPPGGVVKDSQLLPHCNSWVW